MNWACHRPRLPPTGRLEISRLACKRGGLRHGGSDGCADQYEQEEICPRSRDRSAADLRHHLAPGRRQDDAHREAACSTAAPCTSPAASPRARTRTRPRPTGWSWRNNAGSRVSSTVLQFEYGRLLREPARHPGAPRLLRGHLSGAGGGRCRGDGRSTPVRASRAQTLETVRGVPPARRADLRLHQQARPPGASPPLELIDELERVLGLAPVPLNWPLGDGPSFRGVYDREKEQVCLFERTTGGAVQGADRGERDRGRRAEGGARSTRSLRAGGAGDRTARWRHRGTRHGRPFWRASRCPCSSVRR